MHWDKVELVLLSTVLAPLGCISIWRRSTYLVDCISHAGALASIISSVLLLGTVTFSTLFSAALVLLIRWLEKGSDMYVATNIATTTSVAAASLISHFSSSKVDFPSLLLGGHCCQALEHASFMPAFVACAVFLVFIAKFFKSLALIAFNRDLAAVCGVKVDSVDMCFLILSSALINLAILSVGVLLVGSLLILPAVSAQLFARTPLVALLSASVCGLANSVIGISLSYLFSLPAPPLVALVSFCSLLVLYLVWQRFGR